MKIVEIIPTVFASNNEEFSRRFNKVMSIKPEAVQIDIMDGRFVAGHSTNVEELHSLHRYDSIFEAHLMCFNPESHFDKLKEKGFRKAIFHAEVFKDNFKVQEAVRRCEQLGLQPWIAFNPNSNFENIRAILGSVYGLAGVMLLGHTPGVEGLPLDIVITRRIANLKMLFPKIRIQVDGGVNEKTAFELGKAGADMVNVGSSVARAKNPKKAIERILKSFNKGKAAG